MAETVIMPKLGFDMTEGTLVRWILQEGEPVNKGAVLAEIETDKATVEVTSNYSGIVARHLVQTGEIVPVNTPIAIIAAPGEVVKVPAVEIPSGNAPASEEGAKAEKISTTPEKTVEAEPVSEKAQLPGGVRASPLARRMAAAVGIDLRQVEGSGPQGRVTKRDIKGFMLAPTGQEPLSPPSASTIETPPDIAALPGKPAIPISPLQETSTRKDVYVPLNNLRSKIGRRMTEAKQQVPHFYISHEYDVEALLDLRQQTNALLPDDERLSVNDFIVKSTALALRQFPNLNASFAGQQIIQHGSINIGIAVAVEGGLLTVVCRDADRKPLRQISSEVRLMTARARERKVRPEDIEGSTFSVSNLGMFDVENFAAIINPPEAAILAVASARQTPVIREGAVAAGWRMKATIAVDHRVSDGAEAARFMQHLSEYLEHPLRIIL